MPDVETVEISLSKSKLVLMLLGCAGFVMVGVCFVVSPGTFHSLLVRSDWKIIMAGAASVVFFGFIGISLFGKVFDKKPGLIISNEGITDNSSGVSAGFVPWTDIIAIKEQTVARQKFLNVVVQNPQDYIARQKSLIMRKIAQKNYRIFGTNIGISPNSLNIGYAELKKIIAERASRFSIPVKF